MTIHGHRPLPWRHWGLNVGQKAASSGADVTVISQSDYRRAGSPYLNASTKRLVGANDNVLQALGKFNGRLSQGGAVVDEDIYVISGQRRSLLSRRACETLNLVKLVALDSVETADYYKDNNPKLFGGLGRMSGGDYSIQLREDAVPFALSTPRCVSIPLMDVVFFFSRVPSHISPTSRAQFSSHVRIITSSSQPVPARRRINAARAMTLPRSAVKCSRYVSVLSSFTPR